MALSADKVRPVRGRMLAALKVGNADVIYGGAYVGLRLATFGTAGDRGYAEHYTPAAGTLPMGLAQRKVTGDTSASPVPEVEVDVSGGVWERVAVTGVTALTDMGKYVYLSDDDTLTLTRPTVGCPVGIIIRWYSSTTCDCYMFSLGEMVALSAAGAGQALMLLGSIDLATLAMNNPGGAKVNWRTGIPMPYHGKFTSVFAMVDVALAGAATGDAFLLNLEIDGTDVTGGVITLVSNTAVGVKLAGTAITGANEFNEGSVIDVEGIRSATSDDLTGGRIDLYAEVEVLPGN